MSQTSAVRPMVSNRTTIGLLGYLLRLRGMDGGRGRARVMKVTLGWADILYHDLTSCG